MNLDVPEHTTLSRRSATLGVGLADSARTGPIDLIIDCISLAIVGEGEGSAAKHGGKGRRGWKKLHLGADACGGIVAQLLTDSNVDDGTVGVELIGDTLSCIRSVTPDAAYDTRPIYQAAEAIGAEAAVPPPRKASTARRGRRGTARDRTIKRVKHTGRRRWKKESGYHRQGRVENTFLRYKTAIGERLRAWTLPTQESEATVACNVLNRMCTLGWLTSERIAR